MSRNDVLEIKDGLLEKLKGMPPLEAFRKKDLQTLIKISKIENYNPGDCIIEEGSLAGWIYFLISGKVEIIKQEQCLVVLKSIGDVFGEMGAIDASARFASAYAIEETSCLAIDITSLDLELARNKFSNRHLIFRGFAEILAQRLRLITEKYLEAQVEIAQLKNELERYNE